MELKPGERIDDLQLDGLYILQKKDGFRFGMDAVLLADFTRTRPGNASPILARVRAFCRCC